MSTCWYCHWGLPKPVAYIYHRACEELGESNVDYGPGHIVFADENLDDGSVQFCIEACDDPYWQAERDIDRETCMRVKEYIQELLAVPEHVRDCCPEDYDGENPENFPPPDGIEMVSKRGES